MATKKVNPKSQTSAHKTVVPHKTALIKSTPDIATKENSKSQALRHVESVENGQTKVTKIRRDATIATNIKKTVISKTTTTNSVNKNDTEARRTTAAGGKTGNVQQSLRGKKFTNENSNTALKVIKSNNSITSNSYNKSKAATKTKGNAVLDNYHNVTIASPPQKRREISNIKESDKPLNVAEHQQRKRTLTKTLEPEEVLVLKRDSAKQRIETEIQNQEKLSAAQPIKSAIAFEVNFSELSLKAHSTSTQPPSMADIEDLDNYPDDFESYESDFESDESSLSAHDKNTNSSNNDSAPEQYESTETNNPIVDSNETKDAESEEDDSEPTQNPVTVIHRYKEVERELDSGHYDMNFRKHPKSSDLSLPSTQYHYNAALSMGNSEQLDSGVSYGSSAKVEPFKNENKNICYGGYAGFYSKSVLSKRGLELMCKIQLDKLTYKLFEMMPLNYDVYMQSYGKLNTTQASTQTLTQSMDTDCQTDEVTSCCVWTQHPPRYDLQTVQQVGGQGGTLHNCCGEVPNDNLFYVSNEDNNFYESSLQQLKKLHKVKNQRTLQQQMQRHMKPTNFDRFNSFLQHSSLLMSKVLSLKGTRSISGGGQQAQPLTPLVTKANNINRDYNQLNTGFLNALRVRRIFSNVRHQLIITVHECPPENDVYRSDFANLLMIWSTTELKKPLRLLSTWTEVCHAEFCTVSTDIVVCGLRDGSVAMWDLRETYSFCSMLDGHLKHFAATQSVVPSLDGVVSQKLLDLGSVVDVKSFRVTPKFSCTPNSSNLYKSIQFASLNDTGIITIWTLVETTTQSAAALRHNKKLATMSNTRFEHSSPWSRVKLIQSAICDIRKYLEQRLLMCQSQFIHTKSHFQKNIYSDKVLRELKESQSVPITLQGLRFTSIDTGCENIYVCTNRNFILNCTKSLNPERFTHIAINESRFLFPTTLCVLSNENYLAVGLSNGSVLILNCDPQNTLRHNIKRTDQMPTVQKTATQFANIELETGKSCAIQNIILSERRSVESKSRYNDDFELRTTTPNELIDNRKRPFELRVFDQHLLMSGSTLRKDLVQSIVLSGDGWCLYVLANGVLRVFDFYLDKETPFIHSDTQRIEDIAVARTSHNSEHLVILNQDNNVDLCLRTQ